MDWIRLAKIPLNYPEIGATSGELPVGYRHIRREDPIGVGRERFERAAAHVMHWGMQRGAGVFLESSAARAESGALVVVGIGPLSGGCRVIYVVDEPNRRGFAYGTLEGHPESGEEFFGVRFEPADSIVYAQVLGFSRPALWWSKAGSRIASIVQRRVTDRYIDSLGQSL